MNNEPVAWIDKDGNIFYTDGIPHTLPLYTHPVKELSRELLDKTIIDQQNEIIAMFVVAFDIAKCWVEAEVDGKAQK